jgi:hypothetical protein
MWTVSPDRQLLVPLLCSSPYITTISCDSALTYAVDAASLHIRKNHLDLNWALYLHCKTLVTFEFLATGPEVTGSIPGASRFFEKQRVWNGVDRKSVV